MNIEVLARTELRLTRLDLDDLNINLADQTLKYSAIAMFVSSLARCSFAVLDHYAMRMEATTENIAIELAWNFTNDNKRIYQINMHIYWSELADNRIKPVERASHKCMISNTIKDCITINTTVVNS